MRRFGTVAPGIHFHALHDISGERSSTEVFPLPIDLLGLFNKQASDDK